MSLKEESRKKVSGLAKKITVACLSFGFLVPAVAMAQAPGSIYTDVSNRTTYMQVNSDLRINLDPCMPMSSALVEGTGTIFTDEMINCMQNFITGYDEGTQKQIKALMKKRQREEWWDTIKEELKKSMAGAFKTMLRQFSKQLAYDTAVWVASGGKGQQPLYMREGFGAYLRNQLDNALGSFLDELGKYYGVNICEPKFNIKVLIPSFLGERPRTTVRCSFSKMVSNWQSAVSNPNFAVEYNRFLRPGENDISSLLMIQTGLSNKLDATIRKEIVDTLADDKWKPVKDFAGWVLTPGTMVRDAAGQAIDPKNTSAAEYTYTDTLWDFVETFLNTLAGKLLENLMTGFFSGGGGSSSSSSSENTSANASLYNPYSQPGSEGQQGAEERFWKLVEGGAQSGGVYDILNKLTQCSDANKNSLRPTDCVIDNNFAQAIREKKLVKDLPAEILDRQFAPPITANINPQTVLTLRNIIILRKYRIIPVGWEMAGKIISEKSNQNYTLRQLMECYNPCDRFGGKDSVCNGNSGEACDPAINKTRLCSSNNSGVQTCLPDGKWSNCDENYWCRNMVDPNWVLKAPELFCRREGYGIENSSVDQGGGVNRDKYCADEQQCIKENDEGNCTAYGYCTEERRSWDFNAASCEPNFNSCLAFKAQDSEDTISYLTNTLDYRNCDAQVAGCKWHATYLNPISNVWLNFTYENPARSDNDRPIEVLKTCDNPDGCEVTSSAVTKGHSIGVSAADGTITMSSQVCTSESGCSYKDQLGNILKCTIPKGGVSCSPKKTTRNDKDYLADYNGSFAKCSGWNAEKWEEGWGGSLNNRHSCVSPTEIINPGPGASSALESYTLGQQVTSVLSSVAVESNKRYILSFQARKVGMVEGEATRGTVTISSQFVDTNGKDSRIGITLSADDLAEPNYKPFEIVGINNGENDKMTIRITTNTGTFGVFYFDDFQLKEVSENCYETSITLALGKEGERQQNQEVYFDRDVQGCDAKNEGCSQFIRTTAGLGSNLLPNSSFEEVDPASSNQARSWVRAGGCDAERKTDVWHSGQAALALTNCASGVSMKAIDSHLMILRNKKYVLSGWFYATAAGANGGLGLYDNAGGVIVDYNGNNVEKQFSLTDANKWQQQSFSFVSNADRGDLQIVVEGSSMYVDDLKLEEVPYNIDMGSNYTTYTPSERPENQLAYIKKAPDYYNCYKKDNRWPINESELTEVLLNRLPACANFSSVCTMQEVGCERYSPVNKDPAVPGKINILNICPQECVGYEIYRKEETDFERAVDNEKFIADKKPMYCSAAYAGCDEFTNLDEVAKGGEGREYYLKLRACQKPADDDTTYYTWEGSDTTGYQLKTYTLKKSQAGSFDPTGPCTVLKYSTEKGECSDLDNSGAGPGTFTLPAGYATMSDYFAVVNNNVDYSSAPIVTLPAGAVGEPGTIDKNAIDQAVIDDLHNFGVCIKPEINGTVYTFSDPDPANHITIKANADCREFYDSEGGIHYRLFSSTVFSSTDCRPYRRTINQNGGVITCPATGSDVSVAQCDCVSSQGFWNSNGECIYMAIPGQGITCPASAKGCRQYIGNQGNNVRTMFLDSFESDIGENWVEGTKTLSMESTNPGGKSMKASAGTTLKRNVTLHKNKAYILSFWAKSSADNTKLKKVMFDNSLSSADYFADEDVNTLAPEVVLNTTWQKYDLGPVFASWSNVSEFEDKLRIEFPAGVDIYLDNVLLKEVQQNIYLVANTWFTPFACDNALETPFGGTVAAPNSPNSPTRDKPGEMLGCQAYTDRAKQPWYLKSFSRLCREDAVGCEALIDTFNSDSPWSEDFNSEATCDLGYVCGATAPATCDCGSPKLCDVASGATSCQYPTPEDTMTVPSDQVVFMVNDEAYRCSSEDAGCTAYGLPTMTNYDETIGYKTVYLENVPNRYTFDLCRYQNLWCAEFSSQDLRSLSYFKDPRGKICEYTTISGQSYKNWFEKGTATNDHCILTSDQTIGLGAVDEKLQPIGWYNNRTESKQTDYRGWAGLCPKEQSTCTEYIDPLSEIYENLFNKDEADFQDPYYIVPLEDETLYTISARGKGADLNVEVICGNTADPSDKTEIWSPDKSMGQVDKKTMTLSRSGVGLEQQVSGRFYITSSGQPRVDCKFKILPAELNLETFKLARAGIYYQLAKGVDRTGCNGLVDIDGGCVLFNERGEMNYAQSGSARVLDYLQFDADATFVAQNNDPGENPQNPAKGQKNSSSIIRVSPDRECNGWLFCTTYEKANPESDTTAFASEDKCLEIGLCSRFDDKGNCLRYSFRGTDAGGKPHVISTSTLGLQNMSGYSVAGMYPMHLMEQRGSAANVPNGNFESVYSGTKEPMGWYLSLIGYDGESVNEPGQKTAWADYKFSIESDPANRQEGAGYLKLNAAYEADSEYIDVFGNVNYTLSGLINTLNLSPASTKAELLFRELNGSGDTLTDKIDCQGVGKDCSTFTIKDEAGKNNTWRTANKLLAKSGLPWQKVSYGFTTKSQTTRLQLKLMNFYTAEAYGKCHDRNSNTICEVGGYSLFDNIEVNASLQASDTASIQRSCRAYPEQDSLSCKYFKDNQLHYGWSGYCLIYDPLNPRSCLQWWPVDNVAGEVDDEVSGYDNRAPLYYCVSSEFERELKEVKTPTIRVVEKCGGQFPVTAAANQLGGAILDAITFFGNVVSLFTGGGGNAGTQISDAFRGILGFFGIDLPDEDTVIDTGGPKCQKLTFADLRSANDVSSNVDAWMATITGSSGNTKVNGEFLKPINQNNIVYAKLQTGKGKVVNTDCKDYGSHALEDINWSLNANMRALYGWVVPETSILYSASGDLGYLSPGDGVGGLDYEDVTYCAGFVTFYGKDENGHNKGDIKEMYACAQDTGECSDADSFDFYFDIGYMTDKRGPSCQTLVQVVTPMGNNKAWARRVGTGSTFVLPGLGTAYNTDYPPYGSVVPPEPAHYPSSWDTDSNEKFKQKIFHSAPDISKSKPYQARGGEVFSCYNDIIGDGAADPNMPIMKILNFARSFINKYKCFKGCLEAVDLTNTNPAVVVSSMSKGVWCLWRHCTNACKFIGHCSITGSICVSYNGIIPATDSTNQSTPCPMSGETCVPNALWRAFSQPIGFSKVAGIEQGITLVKRLFAKSYGLWEWQGDQKGYVKEGTKDSLGRPKNYNWDVPTRQCDKDTTDASVDNIRPASTKTDVVGILDWMRDAGDDYCAVAPMITNIRLNKKAEKNSANDELTAPIEIASNSSAALEFNVELDPEQVPLSAYQIDWGDGKLTAYSGISLRDRSNIKNKFKLYHYYSYDKISRINGDPNPSADPKITKLKDSIWCNNEEVTDSGLNADGTLAGSGRGATYRVAEEECWIKIKIQARDNWGWCNGDGDANGDGWPDGGKLGYFAGADVIPPSETVIPNCDVATNEKAQRTFSRYLRIKKSVKDFGNIDIDKEPGEEDQEAEINSHDGVCSTGEDYTTEPSCPITTDAIFSLKWDTLEDRYMSLGTASDTKDDPKKADLKKLILNHMSMAFDPIILRNIWVNGNNWNARALFSFTKVPPEIQAVCEQKRVPYSEKPELGDGDCVYLNSDHLSKLYENLTDVNSWGDLAISLYGDHGSACMPGTPGCTGGLQLPDYPFKFQSAEKSPTIFKLHGPEIFHLGDAITFEERKTDGKILSGKKYIDANTDTCRANDLCGLQRGSANGFYLCGQNGDCVPGTCDGKWNDADVSIHAACEDTGSGANCDPNCVCKKGFKPTSPRNGSCEACQTGDDCGCGSMMEWDGSSCVPAPMKVGDTFALKENTHNIWIGIDGSQNRNNVLDESTTNGNDNNIKVSDGACFKVASIKDASGAVSIRAQDGSIIAMETADGQNVVRLSTGLSQIEARPKSCKLSSAGGGVVACDPATMDFCVTGEFICNADAGCVCGSWEKCKVEKGKKSCSISPHEWKIIAEDMGSNISKGTMIRLVGSSCVYYPSDVNECNITGSRSDRDVRFWDTNAGARNTRQEVGANWFDCADPLDLFTCKEGHSSGYWITSCEDEEADSLVKANSGQHFAAGRVAGASVAGQGSVWARLEANLANFWQTVSRYLSRVF